MRAAFSPDNSQGIMRNTPGAPNALTPSAHIPLGEIGIAPAFEKYFEGYWARPMCPNHSSENKATGALLIDAWTAIVIDFEPSRQ
jgi:hypothetical protein